MQEEITIITAIEAITHWAPPKNSTQVNNDFLKGILRFSASNTVIPIWAQSEIADIVPSIR